MLRITCTLNHDRRNIKFAKRESVWTLKVYGYDSWLDFRNVSIWWNFGEQTICICILKLTLLTNNINIPTWGEYEMKIKFVLFKVKRCLSFLKQLN